MMRTKEEAHDYRYFPDPDLLPVRLNEALIEQMRAELPELPQQKQARYQREYGLSAYDATTLTASRGMADYFEQTLTATTVSSKLPAKLTANWLMGDLSAQINKDGLDFTESKISPPIMAVLLARIEDGTLSSKMAKEVFSAMWAGEGDADAIIEARGLKQMSDSGEIERIVDEVLAANQKSVEEFRAGKDKAFNALVGQVMKATRGKANPAQVNDILKKKLGG
jgi:aspartyl-tRNA(Asn)/glutamyl-tRNA(Gln) amidotransferase subunit B